MIFRKLHENENTRLHLLAFDTGTKNEVNFTNEVCRRKLTCSHKISHEIGGAFTYLQQENQLIYVLL